MLDHSELVAVERDRGAEVRHAEVDMADVGAFCHSRRSAAIDHGKERRDVKRLAWAMDLPVVVD